MPKKGIIDIICRLQAEMIEWSAVYYSLSCAIFFVNVSCLQLGTTYNPNLEVSHHLNFVI